MNWFAKMMHGRYGVDQLSFFMTIFASILTFLPWLPADIVGLVIIVLAFMRIFSRNITARRRENEAYLKVWYPVKNFFLRIFKRRPDAKTHKIFRCPKCSQKVRVPRGKGKIAITCPKCAHKFTRKS